MKNSNKITRNNLDKKFKQLFKLLLFKTQPRSWVKVIRESLGMTTIQLAKKIGVTQPRVIAIEKNETNLKIKTLEKIAQAMGCHLFYVLVPTISLNEMMHQQAWKKAQKILEKVDHNMDIENQQINLPDFELNLLTEELLNGSDKRIWDEDG